MKRRLTIICFITAIIFQSCSKDNTNSNTTSIKEKNTTQIENETKREGGSGTYYINELTYKTEGDFIKRYKNDEFQYAFDIVGLNYEVREEKTAFFFENLNSSGEYIKIYNIEEQSENSIVFDAITSEGQLLEDIEYNGEGVGCISCWIQGGLELLKSILEFSGNDEEDEGVGVPEACRDAVEAMAPYCDGFIEYDLEEDWFGTECHVRCVPFP